MSNLKKAILGIGICKNLHTYTYVYTYIFIYVYIYIHVYTYTHPDTNHDLVLITRHQRSQISLVSGGWGGHTLIMI